MKTKLELLTQLTKSNNALKKILAEVPHANEAFDYLIISENDDAIKDATIDVKEEFTKASAEFARAMQSGVL